MAEDELIREIDEDLRRERMERLWREFGKHILGLSVAVVVITIAIVLWQNHERDRNKAATAQYLDASFLLTHEKYEEAAHAFGKIHADYSSQMGNMAGLRQGQALIALGNYDEAVTVLREVAGARRANESVRGMAGLLAATAEARKTGHMPAIASELQDSKNPFAYTAREFTALHLIEEGKKEEAAKLLHAIAEDSKAPASLRTRAEMIAGTLGTTETQK